MDQEQLVNDAAQAESSNASAADGIEDNYRIVRELKNNSQGETLLVKSKDTGKFFVLKHIYGIDLAYKKLASFSDPALPQIIYANENSAAGITTVIEEYLTGTTLDEWMKQRELEPIGDELAKMIFTQLAGGMKALHDKAIMHRAISPKNIMFMGGRVKFIGLDHAAEGKNYEDVSVYKGMIGFAPPEQSVMGRTDFRSDVYSLGMTMQNFLGADYKGKYEKVLKRCLDSSPDERYSNGNQLLKAVKNAGTISPYKIAAACAAIYVLILGGIWFTNHFYDPVKDMQTKQAFAREQKAAAVEAADLQLERGMGAEAAGDGSAAVSASDGSGSFAKGKLGVSLAFPDRPQEENAGVTVVHMGKASDLSDAGGSKGGQAVSFPNNAKLVLSIKNNTDSDIKNPIVKVIPYNVDLAKIDDPPNTITSHQAKAVEYRRDINIPAGGELKFEIPLGKAVLLSPSGQDSALKVVLRSDNYADTAAKMTFAFK
ncbi:serine/threonine protein kinase [Pectinatus haikarae]|uniref:Serine/threonine protein kinase n=2 Tax=Pectinatus haikarae TaxID=349096 RepID=A0ABT9Y514_9FIRM|nr:protein kinase [Pectinatus haikarae]MDQ0202925.1 serine/threonine protein kinase [Pectinatus haikarae]